MNGGSGGRDASRSLRPLLERARVLPVLTVDDPRQAVELVRALAEGGLTTVEITLRTPAALAAIAAVRAELPEVAVGAGSVVEPAQLAAAAAAGAAFAVSPGLGPELAAAARDGAIPLLPGVATASEAIGARERGWDVVKLFPAAPLGGPAYLRALAAPLPGLRFVPTGGIGAGDFRAYLELPAVACVGGSWMAPPAAVAAGDWAAIADLAREAAA